MQFFLTSPDYNKTQTNVTKVRVSLRTGIAEILENHQDLMGKVENNVVEIETNFEGRVEKFLFVLQEGVFIVSNGGLDPNATEKQEIGETVVYLYSSRAIEINNNTSIEDLIKEEDQKRETVEKQLSTAVPGRNSQLLLVQADILFLEKAVMRIKEFKQR
jgi:F0F1-type ATP synthase epsilon subunit